MLSDEASALRVDTTELQLARIFPAFLATDLHMRLRLLGPSIRRQSANIRLGDQLFAHFHWAGEETASEVARLADSAEPIQLYSRCGSMLLRGSICRWEQGYLFAVNNVPAILSIEHTSLEMADFAPSDPTMAALMLVGLQKAMLEESRTIALELARERQRSADLLDRISRVSGYMAHDLNNLLSIVRLNGGRLLSGAGLSPAQSRLVDIMMETAERGSGVTRSLMTLSHQKNDSRIPQALDELIGSHQPFFSTIGGSWMRITMRLEAPDVIVDISKAGLLNCLVNLIINARDAMPDGGDVTISTRIGDAAAAGGRPQTGRFVVIEVVDTGQGMSKEVLERAFEPLFSTKSQGNGIGLASVLEFAREMGGDCRVASAPGQGTQVRLFLPVSGIESAVAAPPLSQEQWDGAKILVVEDEVYALEALTELLEADGFRVTPTGSVADALTALQREPHDVLLTDVIMRGGGGLELATIAAEQMPQMGIVLMSGYVPDRVELRPEWLFIRKPLDTAELRRILHTTVAAQRVLGISH